MKECDDASLRNVQCGPCGTPALAINAEEIHRLRAALERIMLKASRDAVQYDEFSGRGAYSRTLAGIARAALADEKVRTK